MKLVTVSEMQQIERQADASGLTYALMMENAGTGLAEIIHREYQALLPKFALALVGSGNNGGDALVALTWLASREWKVWAYLTRPREDGAPLVEHLVKQVVRWSPRDDSDFHACRISSAS
jgi:NAD(P)H-hydrate epimerase